MLSRVIETSVGVPSRERCRRDTTGKTPAGLLKDRGRCLAPLAKIFLFPKGRSYDLRKSARLDTGDVMAIRHQT
jgi:hypothetical protein